MIRIILPMQLQLLAGIRGEIQITVQDTATLDSVLGELEISYPMLRGTLRDQVTRERRAFIRFFASGEDLSLEPATNPLPEAVATGKEPLRVVGAMVGG